MLIVAVLSSTNTNINASSNKLSSMMFASAEPAAAAECGGDRDTSTETFRTSKNEVMVMCKWATANGKKRLNRKRCGKKKKGNCSGLDLYVKEECPCACSRFIDSQPAPTDQCPIKSEATMENSVCIPTYQDELTCKYDYTWIGCTADTMQYVPILSCTCNDSAGAELEWTCYSDAMTACPTESPGRSSAREEEVPQSRNLIQKQGTRNKMWWSYT
jgi:hypothetical protein